MIPVVIVLFLKVLRLPRVHQEEKRLWATTSQGRPRKAYQMVYGRVREARDYVRH